MDEDCLKLSAYFDERRRSGDRFLADVILGLYEERAIATQHRAARHRRLRVTTPPQIR